MKDHKAFVIPAGFVKNKLDRLVVCNSIAMSVINSVRSDHPEWVFMYMNGPVRKIGNSAWNRARINGGLPNVRVHDLKHTFGHPDGGEFAKAYGVDATPGLLIFDKDDRLVLNLYDMIEEYNQMVTLPDDLSFKQKAARIRRALDDLDIRRVDL